MNSSRILLLFQNIFRLTGIPVLESYSRIITSLDRNNVSKPSCKLQHTNCERAAASRPRMTVWITLGKGFERDFSYVNAQITFAPGDNRTLRSTFNIHWVTMTVARAFPHSRFAQIARADLSFAAPSPSTKRFTTTRRHGPSPARCASAPPSPPCARPRSYFPLIAEAGKQQQLAEQVR